jgi:L-lactate dehydrogenase complex protein LldF
MTPGQVELGMPAFPVAARQALQDSQLRHNLRAATHTIRDRRAAAVAELDDWTQLRISAAAIKDHTLRHLDHYLEQLEGAVAAAGGEVHWAEDAAAANRIVTELVRATGDTDVVKVKSMATQEIGLNQALAEAGITAYETDLAELIVQLADDRPSHILVPAIHRNRAEIRDIFRRYMAAWGRPAPAELTDDPAELAEAARLHLRERFLQSNVGISGANFVVAETGTLVVLESEGNGRMCLTLPRTLISVVGIEKLVPTWRDLEVFLQVLPRSSTAERMNPYTSTWTGVTGGDGPQSFHLVLLDNGRTATLADTVGRQALRCIRCSACLNVCPVYERVGGHAYGSAYHGPIGAILTPQLGGMRTELERSLPYASSLCGACYEVCPVAIDIPEVLVHLRGRAAHPATPGPNRTGVLERAAMRATAAVMLRPHVYTVALRAATRCRRVVPRRLPGPGAAWTDTRELPEIPTESFRDWWRRARLQRPEPPTVRHGTRFSALWRLAARPASRTVARPPTLGGPRERTLERVRTALADVDTEPDVIPIPRDYQRGHREADPVVLSELLATRLAEYRAVVHLTEEGELPALLGRLLTTHGTRRLAVAAGLPAGWWTGLQEGRRVLTDPDDRTGDHLAAADLDAVDSVLTTCAVAIAETGTLVLDGGPGQGRRALTLLPDHHVCVVSPETVVSSVPEAIGRLDPTRALTWISGPSATSDIELRRVEGVHGPRNLEVVLLTPPDSAE